VLVIGGRDEYSDHFNDVWSLGTPCWSDWLLPCLRRLIIFLFLFLEYNEKANSISWLRVKSEGSDDVFFPRANAAVEMLDNKLFVYGAGCFLL